MYVAQVHSNHSINVSHDKLIFAQFPRLVIICHRFCSRNALVVSVKHLYDFRFCLDWLALYCCKFAQLFQIFNLNTF